MRGKTAPPNTQIYALTEASEGLASAAEKVREAHAANGQLTWGH